MTRKVLGFDNWVKGGVAHFARLKPAFDRRGIDFKEVHLGSWGNEPGRPDEETISGLTVRDISYYKSNSLERLLDAERPDLVLFLSTQTFAHRALIRYCRHRGIPTMHLYHGLVTVQAEAGSKTIEPRSYANFVLSKVPKLVTRVFPCYIGSLLKTRASAADWKRFLSDARKLAVGKIEPRASDDAKTDRCAVFAEPDVAHAMRTFGYAREDVSTVGNPDLLRFGLTTEILTRPRDTREKGALMYINSALLVLGRVFAGPRGRALFIQHLIEMDRALREQGYRLMFKPHPSADAALLDEIRGLTQITILDNTDMVGALQECDGCIVEATTLAMVPALMGLPLLLAKFGALSDLRYGPVLTGYPRSHMLADLRRTREIMTRAKEYDEAALRKWLDDNAGPLPVESMPDRVVDIIERMIGPAETIRKAV